MWSKGSYVCRVWVYRDTFQIKTNKFPSRPDCLYLNEKKKSPTISTRYEKKKCTSHELCFLSSQKKRQISNDEVSPGKSYPFSNWPDNQKSSVSRERCATTDVTDLIRTTTVHKNNDIFRLNHCLHWTPWK